MEFLLIMVNLILPQDYYKYSSNQNNLVYYHIASDNLEISKLIFYLDYSIHNNHLSL